MKIKSPLLLFFVLLLSSCSSAPKQNTQYYLLHNHSKLSPNNNVINKAIKVEITIPAYLHQPNLVIKLSKHNLHFAKNHQWAEPLKHGFYKSLISDISKTGIYTPLTTDISTSIPSLNVAIEHFHITENSMVILNGQYWFDDDVASSLKRFNLQLPLEQDGYEHAVAQLRNLITQLSLKITSQQ